MASGTQGYTQENAVTAFSGLEEMISHLQGPGERAYDCQGSFTRGREGRRSADRNPAVIQELKLSTLALKARVKRFCLLLHLFYALWQRRMSRMRRWKQRKTILIISLHTKLKVFFEPSLTRVLLWAAASQPRGLPKPNGFSLSKVQ